MFDAYIYGHFDMGLLMGTVAGATRSAESNPSSCYTLDNANAIGAWHTCGARLEVTLCLGFAARALTVVSICLG